MRRRASSELTIGERGHLLTGAGLAADQLDHADVPRDLDIGLDQLAEKCFAGLGIMDQFGESPGTNSGMQAPTSFPLDSWSLAIGPAIIVAVRSGDLPWHLTDGARGPEWNQTPGTGYMQSVRKTLRQVVEEAAEASYEARRVRTGGKPWSERSDEDRRGYEKAVAAAFEFLPTIGYAVKPDGPAGVIPGMVLLPLEDARALWRAFTRTDVPREATLRAYSSLQAAIAEAEEHDIPELDPE